MNACTGIQSGRHAVDVARLYQPKQDIRRKRLPGRLGLGGCGGSGCRRAAIGRGGVRCRAPAGRNPAHRAQRLRCKQLCLRQACVAQERSVCLYRRRSPDAVRWPRFVAERSQQSLCLAQGPFRRRAGGSLRSGRFRWFGGARSCRRRLLAAPPGSRKLSRLGPLFNRHLLRQCVALRSRLGAPEAGREVQPFMRLHKVLWCAQPLHIGATERQHRPTVSRLGRRLPRGQRLDPTPRIPGALPGLEIRARRRGRSKRHAQYQHPCPKNPCDRRHSLPPAIQARLVIDSTLGPCTQFRLPDQAIRTLPWSTPSGGQPAVASSALAVSSSFWPGAFAEPSPLTYM